MGSEVTGGIHHVEVRDCVFEDGKLGADPVSNRSRAGRLD